MAHVENHGKTISAQPTAACNQQERINLTQQEYCDGNRSLGGNC